jgi:hypothetical protein
MAYTLTFSLVLGKTFENKTLAAQFVDSSGVDTGLEIIDGFTAYGNGIYMWSYEITDSFVGGVKFYEDGIPSELLSFSSINPQETENPDIKTSDIETKIDTQTIMSIDDLSNILGLNK